MYDTGNPKEIPCQHAFFSPYHRQFKSEAFLRDGPASLKQKVQVGFGKQFLSPCGLKRRSMGPGEMLLCAFLASFIHTRLCAARSLLLATVE